MLKRFAEWVGAWIFLARDTKENKNDISELRLQLNELSDTVREMSLELRLLSEREKNEREKFMLQVENALLRVGRQLPEAPAARRRRKK